jgi:hypothetical protein
MAITPSLLRRFGSVGISLAAVLATGVFSNTGLLQTWWG